MKYTKEDFITLIENVAKDKDFKKIYSSSPPRDYPEEIVFGEGNVFENKFIKYESVYDESFWGLSHEKIECDSKKMSLKNIRITFEKEPPIRISLDVSKNVELKRETIKGEKKGIFTNKKVDVTAIFYEKLVDYKLVCGNYKFSLTQDEVDNIYNMIVKCKREQEQVIQDAEIESRFKKYNS